MNGRTFHQEKSLLTTATAAPLRQALAVHWKPNTDLRRPADLWAVGVPLIARQVPELKTERVRVLFHIADEFLTAAVLIVSGVGLSVQQSRAAAIYPAALGMLLYTIIVSSGYFAQKRVWPSVGMFAALLILTIISLIVFWQNA